MITAALAKLQTDEQRNLLSALYQMHKNRFYAIAYEHLHDPQDSEEAVQEAFLRIAAHPDKFFSLSINICRSEHNYVTYFGSLLRVGIVYTLYIYSKLIF